MISEKLLKAEYDYLIQLTGDLWKLERKALQMIPLDEKKWKEIVDESNAIVKKRDKSEWEDLACVINRLLDRIVQIEKREVNKNGNN